MMKRSMPFLLALGALLAGLAASPAQAAPGETQYTQTTDHYKIILTIGPVATMLMPDQAAGAKAGEVMVPMPGMPLPPMSMTDQGQPVNHHLEVAIVNKTSGAVVTDQMPAITIKNDATGATHSLDSVMAMYNVQVGQSDWHYGNNVYLPDGTATITVVANGETATFTGVLIGAGSAMGGGTMTGGPAGGNMGGGSMPATGAPGTALYAALLAAGALALGAGVRLRRATRPVV